MTKLTVAGSATTVDHNKTPNLAEKSVVQGSVSTAISRSEWPVTARDEMPWLLVVDRAALEKEVTQLVEEARAVFEPRVREMTDFIVEKIYLINILRGSSDRISIGEAPPHERSFISKMREAPLFDPYAMADQILKGFDPDLFRAALLPVVLAKYCREQLAHYPLGKFEAELEKERLHLSLELQALEKVVKGSCQKFDSNELFISHGLMQNRVIDTSPLLMPDIFKNAGNGYSPWLIGVSEKTFSEFDGFSYRFGFVVLESTSVGKNSEQDEGLRLVYKPIVCLDEKIFNTLQDLLCIGKRVGEVTPKEHRVATLVKNVLRDIQTFTLLGGHDYIHHMIYGTYYNGSPNNFAPRVSPVHEIQGGNIESLQQWVLSVQTINTGGTRHMNSIESFSHIIHRDTWQKIFSERPKVKERIVERVVNYLYTLGELREELKAIHGESEAGRMTRYLAKVVMAQLNLIVSMEDPIITTPLKNCGTRSLAQAFEELNLPSYNPLPKIRQVISEAESHQFSSDSSALEWLLGDPKPGLTELHQKPLEIIRDIYSKRRALGIKGLELSGFEMMRAILSFEEFRGAWVHAHEHGDREYSAPSIAGLFYDGLQDSGVSTLPSFQAAKENFVAATKKQRLKE